MPKGQAITKGTREDVLSSASVATSESKYIEFKESFNPDSLRDWCEITKDLVAIANSGGGVILIGVDDNGNHFETDISCVLNLDPAQLTDRIARYTGIQFSEFEILTIMRKGKSAAGIRIGGCSIPMVFIKPGTYPIEDGKQRTAFSQGTVYFRHGAKSEPGTTDDLRRALEKEISRVKQGWLKGIKKVVKAPAGHVVYTAPAQPSKQLHGDPKLLGARVTGDENAPAFRPISGDEDWPYRQMDVVKRVNDRLKGKVGISSHDVQSIRKVFDIEASRPDFAYRPFKRLPTQHNEAFVDWLVTNYEQDPQFFVKTRAKYAAMRTPTTS